MAEITGRKVAAVMCGAFAIIIGVNLVMAFQAVSTFPGLEAKNTYVASQEFDQRRDAQEALGWTVTPTTAPGLVTLSITDAAGAPVEVGAMDVLIGRPTSAQDDVTPVFTYAGGVYEAPVNLGTGQWMVKLTAFAKDGTRFEQRFNFYVKG
ncbi:FixH family protein [Xinfangfangia sp. CPCC 101601]|uniref:FixH family protein n=1 Tax=Pseudogemmobacter lacusdianii TaxID=3069608 RepID=A0ABU0VW66_9RHOB|nr:FixH family protein [Xinfangfangia sp. CPCC 101601]MDQ2065943.1 FixH family protein [Xinfangfangia sp. CPCC 101601]